MIRVGTRFCTIVKAVPANGSVIANPDGSLTLKDVSDAVVYVTNVTSFNGFDRDPVKEGRDYIGLAEKRIGRAEVKGFDRLLADHLADYHNLFDRVTLDLGATADSVSVLRPTCSSNATRILKKSTLTLRSFISSMDAIC